MKDNEKGREKHEAKDMDSQPKEHGKGTPGIKMGEYKTGHQHHDCCRED